MRASARMALIALALAAGPGCGKKGEGAPGQAGGGGARGGGGGGRGALQFPVELAPVEARDVQYVVSAVGAVEAFERVQITARVAGAVDRVAFTEGQEVKKGQVLAEIEPTRYSLAVNQARAARDKAQAAAEEAQAGAQRRASVNEQRPGLLPAEELESFQTRARAALAEVGAAKAALDKAELDLRDAYVRAPMDGVLQTRTVQTGQYVQPGAVLATLLRREPLLLRFRVPEGEAGRLKPGMGARFTVRTDGRTYDSKITYVAASADDQSRMVVVTAEVTGEEAKALRPGAFATVSVPVDTAKDSPVIPQAAVRPSERGFLAFVVEGDKARERVLELGLRTQDGLVEVRQGLRPGEQLVVRGAEALKEGVAVRVAEGPKPAFTGEPRSPSDAGGLNGGSGR
ncbi:efflux RND transporter periplasmic adaptor subunit [Stigmatella aurantiaca]|uniref:Efflux transporter, RND family, MFP subunit n=1 Tax=Stigmatella aurantiaca (strain DW4/3-1) TaxID=378806 RepID=Q08MP6_STIAD|nr:efflux RND transporter periplasmic adaptor subunit [Stigmatella aurantiaca]ADO72192.1 Secretion family protein HlyD [Stigmatella aurantiaca DW4/3-1]EAU61756.1 efflux transporter, RND family, MFP subunit [Stigmatella aurantiaca DW4/3-1]